MAITVTNRMIMLLLETEIATLLIGLLLFTTTVSVSLSKYPAELVSLTNWSALKWESLMSLTKAWSF